MSVRPHPDLSYHLGARESLVDIYHAPSQSPPCNRFANNGVDTLMTTPELHVTCLIIHR